MKPAQFLAFFGNRHAQHIRTRFDAGSGYRHSAVSVAVGFYHRQQADLFRQKLADLAHIALDCFQIDQHIGATITH